MQKGRAAIVMVVTPRGIPLVRDSNKPRPIYWKFPGGKAKDGETGEQAGVRELDEEVGIAVSETALKLVVELDRGDHYWNLFRVDLDQLPPLKRRGDEGEEVEAFYPHEILAMEDFFPPHLAVARPILETLLS